MQIDSDAEAIAEQLKANPFLRMDPSKQWIRDRLVGLLSSETFLPSLSLTVSRLLELVKNENATMEEMAVVVQLDAPLAARCLRVASTARHGGQNFENIQDALFLIGTDEIRRIAFTVGVLDSFKSLRLKVNWRQFWLHSALVARLSERIAAGFRDTNGMEYLTGLLHDIGKLVIQNSFPMEFEKVVMRAGERGCGHSAAEMEILGIDHARIGAALCQSLKLDRHIVQGVGFHHQAAHPAHTGDPEGDLGFLACCVSVADTLANMGDVSMGGHCKTAVTLDDQPEWQNLTTFFNCRGLSLNLKEEISAVTQEMDLLQS